MLSHSSVFFIRRESWSRDLGPLVELCRTTMTFNSMVVCFTLCRNCHTSNKTQNKWSSSYPGGITKALQVTRERQGLCGKVSHQPQEGVMSTGHCTDLLRQSDTVSHLYLPASVSSIKTENSKSGQDCCLKPSVPAIHTFSITCRKHLQLLRCHILLGKARVFVLPFLCFAANSW